MMPRHSAAPIYRLNVRCGYTVIMHENTVGTVGQRSLTSIRLIP